MERAAVGQDGGRGDPGENGWYYKLLIKDSKPGYGEEELLSGEEKISAVL